MWAARRACSTTWWRGPKPRTPPEPDPMAAAPVDCAADLRVPPGARRKGVRVARQRRPARTPASATGSAARCRRRPDVTGRKSEPAAAGPRLKPARTLGGDGCEQGNDVPHLLEGGETAQFSGLSSHYYTTEDSPAVTHTIVGHPRDCPVRAASPSRATIDFDSTTAGYTPVGPHCAVGCGSLETTAPPGSPVPVGRFRCPARPASVGTRRPITAIRGHYCRVT